MVRDTRCGKESVNKRGKDKGKIKIKAGYSGGRRRLKDGRKMMVASL